MASNKIKGITSTQLIEDTFNFQKNSKVIKGKKKFRRPEKAYGVVLARQVLSKVHRYHEPPIDAPLSHRSVRLPGSAFQPVDKPAGDFPIGQIVSTVQKSPWYSPSAANWSQAHADLALLRDVSISGSWASLSTAWLGVLCQRKHKILLRRGSGGSEQWFALHHWSDSAVLVWPALAILLPDSTDICYVPDLRVHAPCLLPVVELSTWEALSFQWRSPAWQLHHYPALATGGLEPAIRAFGKTGLDDCNS